MRRQAKAWLSSARDDLTHMAAFHCQQSIEKAFKAVLEEHEKSVPRVHDLITLRNQVEKYVRLTVESDLMSQINELYIDARYPSDLGLLPGGKPPRDLARKMYHFRGHDM